MDELEKFISFLYEGSNGFVYSPIKVSESEWESNFFAWPAQKSALLSHIGENGQRGDVYISPAVYSKKDAKRESFKSTNVVWVEFDGKDAIDFQDVPQPNAIVQTSTDTHVHCYWKIDKLSDSNAVEDLNRRLTYHLQADSSGSESNQLLRPPGTINHKRGLPVLLAHFGEQLINNSLESFAKVPEVPHAKIELTQAIIIDSDILLKELPLPKSLKIRIEKEAVLEGQRSQFLYKIAHELAELGCSHSQIASLIFFVDERIGKFKDRPDRLARISEISSIAIHSVATEEFITLYSPNEVLNFTEDLEWLLDRYLHSRGLLFVAGAPGVGKTQFCIQMSYAFATGTELLNLQVAKSKVLFMSLEMDVRELKEVLKTQKLDYPELVEFDANVRFIDEPGTLIQYEDIIEEFNPDVIIIDSLMELVDGDINSSTDMKAVTKWFKRLRRKYNTALVVIHHMRKASSGNKKPTKLDDFMGSVVLNKDIESAFALWQEEDTSPIEFIVAKARYTQKGEFTIERTKHLTFQRTNVQTTQQQTTAPGVSVKLNFGM